MLECRLAPLYIYSKNDIIKLNDIHNLFIGQINGYVSQEQTIEHGKIRKNVNS